ncbi:hypothetical protein VV869_20445 [Photobacterium sp. MCCC 1A19761]|uniref:hypothetical protein n=1 Tax=Photobacterium sp. MCCC 1A19761 TaxID=3115000 RepID=UPI00307F9BFB
MKTLVCCLFACALAGLPITAQAKWDHHGDHHHKHRHHKHKHHKHRHYDRHDHHYHRDVVVVQEQHYHKSRLPEIATFAVIAGVTYAIVNNTFYKKSGDEYRAVERPAYR